MNTIIRDERSETIFRAHGVDYELLDNVPLDDIQLVTAAQVRGDSEIAPQDQVNLYTVQMAAGVQFPPVVLWNKILIDGNTRIAAAEKAGRPGLPAYRVQLNNQEQAKDLAAGLNQINGRRLARTEAHKRAIHMMDSGYRDAFIAQQLGYEPSKVRRWRQQNIAEEKARALDVAEQLDQLSPTNRAKVSTVTHDKPFAALVTAMAEREVPTTEVPKLIERVKNATSDDDAVEQVHQGTADLPRRGAGQRPGHQRKIVARDAYRAIGALLAHPAEHWVDLGIVAEATPRWEQLRALADQVLTQYEQHRAA
jgi:hypothetical protein